MNAGISPGVGILLMLNNYVHDVATGLLLLSALWVGWSARDLGDAPHPAALELFAKTYRRCVAFVWGSLVVIIVTGVVRTIFFMRFEWFPALGRGLVPILVLNACQSGSLSGVEAEAAVATRLIREGAAAVIAMGYSVYAVAAAEFMAVFYESLFRGDTFSLAAVKGRKQMRRSRMRPRRTWCR